MLRARWLLALILGIVCTTLLLPADAAAALPPAMSANPAGDVVLVRDGVSQAPIVVPSNTASFVREAAEDLAGYIRAISGARPEIVEGAPTPLPQRAIYVGYQPVLARLFPQIDFDFTHPEEILISAGPDNVVICGRDRSFPAAPDDERTATMTTAAAGFAPDPANGLIWFEAGTSCAVYDFIENCLQVRWLWQGPIGTDVIQSNTIALPSFVYRYHPVIRLRKLNPRWMKQWYRWQRIWYYSNHWLPGHSFMGWWDEYHQDHPEIFALRGNEGRTPPLWGLKPNPKAIKLCVSNPEVRALLLDQVAQTLQVNPSLEVVRAIPNDGWGFCSCAACKAMDHPDAAKNGRHSDRYVKFWNVLARDLKQRFPERDLLVGAAAYSLYREPPVEATLDEGIAVAHVGHFPTVGRNRFEQEKKEWLAWADMAEYMVYRPNLFRTSGAFDERRPAVELHRTIEAFDFLVKNKCVGIDVDTLPNSWALHGPYYYLMAQLMYHPDKDGEAVLDDYFQRGFGPAAADVEQYFRIMEKTNYAVLDALEDFVENDARDLPTGKSGRNQVEIRQRMWSDEALVAEAAGCMRRAEEKLAGGPEMYRKRLEFMRIGYDYFRLSAEIVRSMLRLQEDNFSDVELAEKALELYRERERLFKSTWESKGHYLRYSLSSLGDLSPPAMLLAPRYGRMKRLAEDGATDPLLAEFGDADLTTWPEDVAGQAFLLRARAFASVGDVSRAIADYTQCVDRMSPDEKAWGAAVRALADMYIKDEKPEQALGLYRRELPRFDSSEQAGSFIHGMALLQAVRLLERQGKDDEALDRLTSSDIKSSTPRFGILEAIGDILAKQGRGDAARASYLKAVRMYANMSNGSGFYARNRNRVTKKLEALDETKGDSHND